MAELLIGCGNNRERRVRRAGDESGWTALTTLDIDPNCNPDYEWNLNRLPLPFEDESFDEIHAYEVLEHVGRQGDWRFFFAQWYDFWRILKPDGLFYGTSPGPASPWLWGDPGHTRQISPECLTFLRQPEYDEQLGHTMLTDYRHVYRADFEPVHLQITENGVFAYVLQAVKPSRVTLDRDPGISI